MSVIGRTSHCHLSVSRTESSSSLPSSPRSRACSDDKAVPSSPALDGTASKVLIALDVAVAGLCPFWQGVVSRSSGFDGSTMVLAETASYVLGGVAIAGARHGPSGVRRCVSPWRYLVYLPASVAFSMSNVCTYVAVRGLGASQFTLMAQLRIVVLALLSRFWNGVRQSALEWMALAQLALGMVVLVVVNQQCGSKSESGAADADEFVSAVLSLLGVILLSAVAYIYMEGVLKANAAERIYIQQHQLNFFGCASALFVYLSKDREVHELDVADDTGRALEDVGFLDVRMVVLLFLVVARGVLCSMVIKNLDCITKGLVDITSIILCTVLQIVFDGMPFVPTNAGLQAVILLSIMLYFIAKRAASPGGNSAVPQLAVPSSALGGAHADKLP